MSADADHEVIDSPEALFRHLYEAHGVQEALELDPETAPVQFWVRRHAELEREARVDPSRHPPGVPWTPPVEARPEPRSEPVAAQRPEGPGPGREGRRPAAFGDPLVEAVARALAGRGYGEAAVRGAIRGYASPAGGRTGEAALRGDLIEPMLRAAAERLLGAAQQPPPAERVPGSAQQPPPTSRRPAEPQAPRTDAPVGPPEGSGEPRRGAPVDPEGSGEPRGGAPVDPEGSGEPQGGAAANPEAAWAVFWADLAETAPRRGAAGTTGGADDDLMAVADAVQRRRKRRPSEHEPRQRRR
jgi:hypothetical protein